MHAQLALLDGAQSLNQRRHVEDIAQALAIGLKQQRKLRIARSDTEQIVGALAQLPQRRALIGAAARQQQSASGSFAKAARQTARSIPSWRRTSCMASADFDQEPIRIGRLVGIGKAQHEAVIAPERFHLRPAGGANARAHRHGPWNMNAAAERREHADAPIAQLVAAALDHDGAVVGNLAGRLGLVGEKTQQIFRRAGIEIVLAHEARERGRPAATRAVRAPWRRCAGQTPAVVPGPSPFQNGILPGSPGAGVTSTRSCVMSAMRHVDAPRMKVSLGCDSKTISSSSSPTRTGLPSVKARKTP